MFKKSKQFRVVALFAALLLVLLPTGFFALRAKDATPTGEVVEAIVQRAEALPLPPALVPATVDIAATALPLTGRLPFAGYMPVSDPRPQLTPGPVENPNIDKIVADWKEQLVAEKPKAEEPPPKHAEIETPVVNPKPEEKPVETPVEKPVEDTEKPTEDPVVEPDPVPEELPVTGSGNHNSMQYNGMLRTSDLKAVAPDYTGSQTVPKDFFNAISGRSEISVNEFKALAKQYKLSGQFVQRFIDDSFVYRAGSDYHYYPVDFSLAQHRYNWDNLVHSSGEDKNYVVNGSSRISKGVDVSVHQGNINWEQVKADGIDFAYIRLGYTGYQSGAIKIDEKFDQNMQGAIAAGVKVGVYYYSQAITKAEAVNEAEFVLENVQGYNMDLPVAFDIEGGQDSSWRTYGQSRQTLTNVTKAFCSTIEQAGHPIILYSYSKFLTEQVDLAQLQKYDIWLAQYYYVPFFPYNFQIWQYSYTGQVRGIKNGVDLNMMFLDYKK